MDRLKPGGFAQPTNTMNPIESILPGNQTYTGATTRQATGSSVMGKDEFLLLLVTQLRNQDPTNPMDGQQFAAQLAQFSSVEQLINIDQTLAANGEMNSLLAQSVNSGVAAGLIGKTVEAAGNTVTWNGEGEAALHFEIGKPAGQVTVTIRDEAGNVVRELSLDDYEAGKHTVAWDGETNAGTRAASGTYTFEVKATGGKDGKESIPATTFIKGRVDRITFGAEGIQLWLGDTAVLMGAVQSVQQE